MIHGYIIVASPFANYFRRMEQAPWYNCYKWRNEKPLPYGGGLTFGTTIHPYDGQGKRVGKKIDDKGLFGSAYIRRAKDILSSRFLIPPFSILNTRTGEWQERKRQWIDIGIKSEIGRGYTEESAAYGSSLGKPGDLRGKYRDASPWGSPRPAMSQKGHVKGQPIARGDGHGRPLLKPGLLLGKGMEDIDSFRHKAKGIEVADEEVIGGTSIFDPVLCELIYRWFAPAGGRVLDPFAGGSVRGIVAGELGLHYTGVDLSERQIIANRTQAETLKTDPSPEWHHGDSLKVLGDWGADAAFGHPNTIGTFDLIFSCPPYGDLEVYSQDPADISNMSTDDFDEAYMQIISNACALLGPEGFACFVVGDYRNKDGFYCNLPAKTIVAFEDAGLRLYNYAILINAIGSLPLRINAQFAGSRKLGKCHQDVLIFSKGQPKDFVKKWPPITVE